MAVATAISDEGVVDVRDRADIRRQIKLVVVFGLVALALVFFYLRIDDFTVTYTLGERVTRDDPAKSIDAQPIMIAGIVVAAVSLLLAAAQQGAQGCLGALVYFLVGVAFFSGFVIWCYADQTGTFSVAIINPFPGTIRLATPLIFGALAGVPVRALRRHQHRDRGPVPDGRLLRGGRVQPVLQRGDGPGRRDHRRRRAWPRCSASSRSATRSTRSCSASC